MRNSTLKMALVLAVALGALPALAQKGPNDAIGFDPGKLYQFMDTDSVDLFNGNLLINLPIGQRFTVSPALSYGLTLSYNSAGVWDYEMWEFENPSTEQIEYRLEAFPNYRSNAGPGWRVSLGRLLEPTNGTLAYPYRPEVQHGWVYEGPSGDEHPFLNPNYPSTAIMITKDEAALRMIEESPTVRIIEFPSGERHRFEKENAAWRLKQMLDRFGNSVNIAYTYDTNDRELTWTITDSASPRTHTINFQYFSAMAGSFNKGQNVASIDLEAINGTRARYWFFYEALTLPWGCRNDGSPASQPQDATLPMLSSVVLPDGTSFLLNYHTTNPDLCNEGGLARITYPTGGFTDYTYQPYSLSAFNVCSNVWFGNPLVGGPAGVKSRSVFDGSTTRVWEYVQRRGPKVSVDYGGLTDEQVCEIPYPFAFDIVGPFYWTRTSVLSPVDETGKRNRTDQYFNIFGEFPLSGGQPMGAPTDAFASDYRDVPGRSGPMGVPPLSTRRGSVTTIPEETWEGYPSDVSARDSGGRFLISESFEGCDAAGDCTNGRYLRSTYQLREGLSATWPGSQLSNPRFGTPVKSTRTMFQDDAGCGGVCETTTTFDSYNGAGRYGTATHSSNFPGSQTLTTSTAFEFWTEQDVKNEYRVWITSLYSQASKTQNGTTLTEQYAFDPNTGFLNRHRVLQGTVQGSTDVLNVFVPNARGEVQYELTYGGNMPGQALSTGSLATLALPSTPWYKVEHSYANGLPVWSRLYDRTSGQSLSFRTLDRDIDPGTGLTIRSRDSAGVETAYSYDTIGRIKSVAPYAQSQTTYTYNNAVSGNPARVEVKQFNASGQTLLGHQRYIYDGLGRVRTLESFVPTEAQPNGEWVRTQTDYNASGWKSRVTEPVSILYGPNPAPATLFAGYDAFGRVGTVQAPDGTVSQFTYLGERSTSRTVSIHGAGSATTTENYDGHGRLFQVVEPSGTGGGQITTQYTYDPAGRLTRVCQNTSSGCGQERLFIYDGRGFLNQEVHPEAGATLYEDYDPLGRVTRTRKPSSSKFDRTFEYDSAGRLLTVRSRNPSITSEFRLLKEFTFGTSNVSSNLINGKLASARRHNYIPEGAGETRVTVTEDHKYGDASGRRTERTTTIRNETTSQILQVLRQAVVYDDLGNITTEYYPECNWVGCSGGPGMFNRIERAYTLGRPSSVNSVASTTRPAASAIGYLPNGMVGSVTHGNGVTEIVALDPSGMARPGAITFSGFSEPCESPVITVHPQSSSVATGNQATVSVTATGTALSYQWFEGGSPGSGTFIPGATGSSYTSGPLTSDKTYSVRVANACGVAESLTATITVCTPPSITTQPAGTTISSGGTATLSVAATGSATLSYQWYRGVTPNTANEIIGATSSVFTTPALTATTSYWVQVTNSCGVANSVTATVSVNDCTAAPTITTQPTSFQTILSGQTATLSVTAGGTEAKTYQWWYRHTMYPISGATSNVYTTPPLNGSGTISNPNYTDYNYGVIVTNACGVSYSEIATVRATCPGLLITKHPQGAEVSSGDSRSLYVEWYSAIPATVQWYKNGSPIPGATSQWYSTGPLTESATYYARVSTNCRSVNSYSATITVVDWREYTVSLATYCWNVLEATDCGGSDLNASASSSSCGLFALRDLNGGTLEHGDMVQLRSPNGYWVVAEGGGGGELNANRTTAAEWETFQISNEFGWGPIESGQKVNFRSYYGYYIVAEWGGSHCGGTGEVNCSRTSPGAWETFNITFH